MHPDIEILIKAGINIVAAFTLTYALFYRRYRSRELFVTAMILNVSVFCVMSIITDGSIGLQAGLGLFAILSILRFRSENFGKMEMAYFFGAVALAAVNGIAPIGPTLIVANALILLAVFLIDGPFLMRPVDDFKVYLDRIPDYLFDEVKAKSELGKQFNVDVIRFEIREIDYVKDTAGLRLHVSRRANGIAPKPRSRRKG